MAEYRRDACWGAAQCPGFYQGQTSVRVGMNMIPIKKYLIVSKTGAEMLISQEAGGNRIGKAVSCALKRTGK